MTNQVTITPMMKQYREMKAKHPDAILLFRVGDLYETFSDKVSTDSRKAVTTQKNTMKTTKTIGMEKLNYLTRLITHGSVFVPVNIAKQVQQAAINLGFDVSAGICDTGEIALYTA